MNKNIELLSELYKFFHKQLNKEQLFGKEIAHVQLCFEQLEKELKKLDKSKKNNKP